MSEDQSSIRVLHVDDESEFLDLATTYLSRQDDRFTIETATSADAGLDCLATDEFDCVISDYDMPGMTGIDFLQAVREDSPDLPFILFTGKGSEEVASEAISAGVTDYLQKQRGTEQYELLANRVTNAVEQRRARTQAQEHHRVSSVVRKINRALVQARNREEIDHRVCQILTDADPYVLAWIGTVDPATDRIEPQAAAGSGKEAYLDTITVTVDDSPTGHGPGGTAVRENRVVVSQDIDQDETFAPWREDAREQGYRAVAAIPLTHEDTRYGLLAVYADPTAEEPSVAAAKQVSGEKGMSYVNYIDAEGGLDLVKEFEAPAAAVIKHANPAGCATAEDLVDAYDRALATDPKSAFGGVVALNRGCDRDTAERIVDSVKHGVVAPGYADGVLDVLGERENMRVLDVSGPGGAGAIGPDDRSVRIVDQPVTGGRLVQHRDLQRLPADDLEVVTEREPTDEQIETMLFAWQVTKHVTSNAIVFADGTETVGLGVGQVSRVDAVEIAAKKAERDAEGKSSEGAVMASDAFFPFPDNVETAAEAGIEAIVQPGGSIRDDEVIAACDELGLAMCLTGQRAFRHD
jgi:CheY-like chemotaxis protein